MDSGVEGCDEVSSSNGMVAFVWLEMWTDSSVASPDSSGRVRAVSVVCLAGDRVSGPPD